MDIRAIFGSIKNVFKYGSSLSQNANRSIFWIFSQQVIVQSVNLVKLAILAKILGPEPLGLIGIALLTYSLLTAITQTGTKSALIHKKGDISRLIHTGFTINFFRNIFLFIVIVLISKPVSILYDAPESRLFIIFVGISLLIDAFTNMGTVYFRKNLDFRKEFVYQISADLSNIFVTIAFTFILRSAWAIIIGILVGTSVKLVVGYILHPMKPKLNFDLGDMRQILNYSVWIFVSSIFGFLIVEGDDAYLGIALGATALGLYQMAYKIGNLPATKFSLVLAQIAMPTYAKLQDQPEKLDSTYLTVLKGTMTITTLMVGVGIFLTNPVVTMIFGEQWLPMIISMQILLVAGYFRGYSATIGPMFLALGIPKKDTLWQGIRLLIIVVTIVPLTNLYGMEGTSLSIAISILIASFGFTSNNLKILNIGLKSVIFSIVVPVIALLITIGVMFFLTLYFPIVSILGIFAYALLSVFIYFPLIMILDKLTNYGILEIVHTNLKSMLVD